MSNVVMRVLRRLGHIFSKCFTCICPADITTDYRWKPNKNNLEDEKDIYAVPINQCMIKSSHNSTLNNLQIFGTSELDMVIMQLNDGFRCIELDIHKHPSNDIPIVTHGNVDINIQTTSFVYLEDVLKIIKKYAWKDTKLPLFLCIEIQVEQNYYNTYNKIYELFHKYLHNRIIDRSDLNYDIHNLPNKKIEDFLNKVIIFYSNVKHIPYLLSKYLFISLESDILLNISSEYNLSGDRTDKLINWNKKKLTRVYPKNKILSENFDTTKFADLGCNFTAINYQNKDKFFKEYITLFQGKSIIKKPTLLEL